MSEREHSTKELWAVELNVHAEAIAQGLTRKEHWIIHGAEDSFGDDTLCVYEKKSEAQSEANLCRSVEGHTARVVRFVRAAEEDKKCL